MKKALLTLLIIPLLLCADEPSMAIHNRPLIKVNGRTISVIDVMKKMNAFIYQNYPHAINNKAMLYQFYSGNWRSTLDEMINSELMLLEAEAKEIKVSDADVREKVEERYGPNVMEKL
ncbi:MAG TPA: SurA N-terminal domain-containing protein, partial [Chlamydiales bacterium]|nr:SurA N-terminal domain-containing protein [Chlamydiales bacterium]